MVAGMHCINFKTCEPFYILWNNYNSYMIYLAYYTSPKIIDGEKKKTSSQQKKRKLFMHDYHTGLVSIIIACDFSLWIECVC